MNRRHLLAALAGLPLLACSVTPEVFTDFDPGAAFAGYRTFAFLEPDPVVSAPPQLSPLIPQRLVDATRAQLVGKGLTESEDPESADLIVTFTLGARDRVQVTEYPGYYRRGPYTWGGSYYNDVDVRSYEEGTLSIDLYDVKKQAPVWHGKTSRAITEEMRENPDETINEVIAQIMAEYPPSRDE